MRYPALASAGTPVPLTHHGLAIDRWSLRDVITLPAEPASVPQARAHVRQTLGDWGFGRPLREDAALVVTELSTNAIRASARMAKGAFVPVAVGAGNHHGPGWLLVSVADASPDVPLLSSGEETCGRGLRIVAALSARWGWHPVRWPEADPWLLKVVWAEFTCSQSGGRRDTT